MMPYCAYSTPIHTMPQFNPRTIPLAHTHLIEASAGTGKTHGIATLFTRLILQGSAVERIIVVTFTDATAAELKTRLRRWLNETLHHLQQPEHDTEPDIVHLIEDAQHHTDHLKLIERLQTALHAFDTAAIYTIHGFCLRILSDQALLCGIPFDIQIGQTDPSILLRGIQDHWRQHIVNDPELAQLVAKYQLTPQSLLAKMHKFSQQPLLRRHRPEDVPLAQYRQTRDTAWQNLKSQLTEIEENFWKLHPKLPINIYQIKSYQALFAQLHTIGLPEDVGQLILCDPKKTYATNLLLDTLRKKHKKAFEPNDSELAKLLPLQQFILAHRQFQHAQMLAITGLELQILNIIDTRIEAEKKRHNKLNFNDLLLEVHHALHHSPHHATLARTLAEQCDAVLIDEFQDTDPLQYAIFHTAFIQHDRPVFLVGDPKQAIYAFRGADIQAYLAAARDIPTDNRHSLTTNYRSNQSLITAVATLFDRNHPFVLPEIPYIPIHANRTHSKLEGKLAALNIRWLNSPDTQNETKETLNQKTATYCARDIAALLKQAQQGYLKLDQKNVQAEDIVILVRTHKQAQRIRRALEQHGIRSICLQKQSVFHTPPARAIAALLHFFLEPQRTELLRFVLTGVLYGFDAAQLDNLNHNANDIDRWTQWAHQAAQTWQQDGIFTALMRFAAQSQLESQLLRRHDERSLTDFWHLAELLATQAFAHTTPHALLAWFEHKIQTSGKENQQNDTQLRLESDENRVKIITMHTAKGLEYPIVFCPFVWDSPKPKSNDWQIVRRDNENWLLPQHELTEQDLTRLQADQLGEDLRLLYVALTRAKESLTLYVAAQNNSTPNNPLAYLLAPSDIDSQNHQQYWSNSKHLIETYQHALHTKLADLHDLRWHHSEPPATVYHETRHKQHYTALVHPHRTWHNLQQSSFTALSRNATATAPHPTDRLPEATDTDRLPEDGQHALLTFPRGTQAGVCLHRILELADFQQNAAAQSDMIDHVLHTHGYSEPRHQLAAHTLLDHVRHTPLTHTGRLCDIPIGQQSTEWGFLLHTHRFSRHRLLDWFARQNHLPPHAADHLHQLDFPTLNGFLNGFIDHLAQDTQGQIIITDFKSNHLGNQVSDYHQDAMSRAVSRHQYALQALIYAVAAARHFRRHQTLPDTIAIRYLFVRGLNPYGNEGIWCWDIPSDSLHTWLD